MAVAALPREPRAEHDAQPLQVDIARDTEQVLSLRQDWQALSYDFGSDIDIYLTVLETDDEILRPHVISLRRSRAVKSILVGRIDRKRIQVAFGYKKVSSPRVRLLTIVIGGMLGDDSEESAAALIQSVRKMMTSGEADAAWFYGLETDSPLHAALQRAGGFFTQDRFPGSLRRWRIRLPATYNELLKSRSQNTRHNLKRYSKRLLDAFGSRLTVRAFRDTTDMERMLADTEAVASQTYHRGLGVGFVNSDQMRRLMHSMANRGWLRSHLLYIDEKPAAFWNGVLYRRTFFTWTTGYDPNLRDYRPGTYLMQRMLEDVCAEQSADEVDFGLGDAQYKRDWCDHEHRLVSQFLYAPTARGVSLSVFRSFLLGTSLTAKSLLARTGALAGLKKAWRSRLSK